MYEYTYTYNTFINIKAGRGESLDGKKIKRGHLFDKRLRITGIDE